MEMADSVRPVAGVSLDAGAAEPHELSCHIGEQVLLPGVQDAAAILGTADFLLLAGGAGMSADSGLFTFASMTDKLGSLLGQGVTYDQAAGVDMMAKNPSLFYGFWFASASSYAKAEPHEGYAILRRWRELVEKRRSLAVPPGPASTFSLTSNVDGFLRRSGVSLPNGLAQVHGCVEKWQCGGVPSGKRFPLFARGRCSDELFDPPTSLGFDPDAMRYDGEAPRCPRCGDGVLRPHVYLFGDGNKFVDAQQETGTQDFSRWCEEVRALLSSDASLRLAIVEIGCGLRVPNIRKRCEEFLTSCPREQARLIRINPEAEATDQQFHAPPSVVVKAGARVALKSIHMQLERSRTSAQ
uniref:Deacetylase sirtuin-type domain-containing protein n=1 Tax=Noctiluca scintillans TaxID=2966 RepID=A0A7S0ZNS7_NOCSC|mmetsp:Transcript_12721/g.35155  ORF Transcript_12721/g.35155 Transcript_12721/m.35155 type:complete len:354 (+) Transcript_12721:42-1103(+)